MRLVQLALATLGLTAGLQAQSPVESLAGRLERRIESEPAEISLVYLNPATQDSVLLAPRRRFHAASTMKVPVLVALAREIEAGALRWEDSLPVLNRFRSIVDGSEYALSPADDSDSTLYAAEGLAVPVEELAHLMIARSSNLATNLLIQRLDPAAITRLAIGLGADSIQVLRGVEDNKAYQRGLNNTTTALDLARLLEALAGGRAGSPVSTRRMLGMLLDQEFNDRIPAALPAGVKVAHKTGDITRIAHDAAIVYPPGGGWYVLVILTRGYDNAADASRVMAELSGEVYRYATMANGESTRGAEPARQ